jgi:Domain of unknown function (DUF397)
MTTEWRKSSVCTFNGHCVEVREHDGGVQVRNSKAPGDVVLTFTRDEWAAFVGGVLMGEFDQFAG